MTYRLSFTFSILVAFRAALVVPCYGARNADTVIETVPIAMIAVSTAALRIGASVG
jgi:hypothetical protein